MNEVWKDGGQVIAFSNKNINDFAYYVWTLPRAINVVNHFFPQNNLVSSVLIPSVFCNLRN